MVVLGVKVGFVLHAIELPVELSKQLLVIIIIIVIILFFVRVVTVSRPRSAS